MDTKLENVIRKVFELNEEKIDEKWTSDDIPAWDSLGHLNLIMEIEREYNIKVEIEEMFDVESIADIDTVIKKKI